MIIIARNLLPGCDFRFETGQNFSCNGTEMVVDLLLRNILDDSDFLTNWLKSTIMGFESIVEGVAKDVRIAEDGIYVYDAVSEGKVLFYPRAFEGFVYVNGVKYPEARLVDMIVVGIKSKGEHVVHEAAARAMVGHFRALAKSIDDTVTAGYPVPLYAPKGGQNVHE